MNYDRIFGVAKYQQEFNFKNSRILFFADMNDILQAKWGMRWERLADKCVLSV